MNGARRLFLPVYGIGAILTLVAITTWLSGGLRRSDGLILGVAVALVWIIIALARRKRP